MMARSGYAMVMLFALAMGARSASAQARCSQPRSIELEIQIEPPDTSTQHMLERYVTTELQSSALGPCATHSEAVRAIVQIQAVSDLSQVLLTVQKQTPFERRLELTALPFEARPSAIASAADELLRAVLAQPRAASEESRLDVVRAEVPPAPEHAQGARPLVELGVAAAASSFVGEREALGGDVLGRFLATPRLSLSARVGASRRVRRPIERGIVQPSHDLHAGLGLGVLLLAAESRIELLGEAGVNLLRVGFDEGFPPPANPQLSLFYAQGQPLDQAWALVGSLGAEARVRVGDFGLGAALAALVPLVPATSDWAETTSLQHLGAELRVGLWVPFGK